ncbi:MAG: hypothetical protein KF764_16875 [Labilithrix sp.]|nr:hypothetical protein [Labilithrix sp.]MBX3224110.1 hypothetical protein [Labilithrix sp.]
MIDLATLATSGELTSDVLQKAASSSQELKRLVTRLGEIAQPEQGFTRLLKVIARVAAAEWMEGDLQVELNGDDKGTTIAFYAVLGAGIRERLFGAQYLQVPIDEFQRAVVLAPAIIEPLRAHQGLNRLTLSVGSRVGNKDLPDFELEEKAKGDGERITAPPPSDLVLDEPEVHTKPTSPPVAD